MSVNYNPSVVTSGLLLNLDAGNLKSYPTSGTAWTDLSGNANNGTLTNGPTYNASNGGSIIFDGIDDYVSLPNGLLNGTGDFTVNQWIKSLSTGNNGTIFANYPSGNLQIFYGQKFFGIYLGTAIYACSVSPCAYYTSNWSMITASRSGTSVGLYLNANLICSGTTANSIGTTGASFRLGTNTSTTEQFTGNISVTQVYNCALSAAEVLQNYNALRGRYGL
jgi:hypothetical protein